MRGRPPLYDLTGQTFGSLTVEGRDPVDQRYWTCRCQCGKTIALLTAQLRWQHRKSCGCRKGFIRDRPKTWKGLARGYRAILVGLKDMIPPAVIEKMGPADSKGCSLCGIKPAKFLASVYGILDPRFNSVRENPDNWMTLCTVCRERMRVRFTRQSRDMTPESWFSLVPKGIPLPEGLRGAARLLLEHQLPAEQEGVAGIEARAKAQEALNA